MAWSIQQVARLSGVTARTLRYYDEIGLLRPARTGANGYRYYERVQLSRLQQILLLKEIGLDLATIATVVDGQRDELDALRAHHRRLLADRDQLDAVVRTVETTIAHLERGAEMPAEEMFTFNRDAIDELEAKAAERSGGAEQPYFDELRRRTADWTPEQFREVDQQAAEIERRLLALLRDGFATDDLAVSAVLDDDVAAQQQLLPLDGPEYARLGEAFVTAPELRAHLDAQDPRLAEYMRDAMAAYAAARMG